MMLRLRYLLPLVLLSPRLAAQELRDSATISSDGVQLFVELRAADSAKPVVLFLQAAREITSGPCSHS
jgi:hypothetical protein